MLIFIIIFLRYSPIYNNKLLIINWRFIIFLLLFHCSKSLFYFIYLFIFGLAANAILNTEADIKFNQLKLRGSEGDSMVIDFPTGAVADDKKQNVSVDVSVSEGGE